MSRLKVAVWWFQGHGPKIEFRVIWFFTSRIEFSLLKVVDFRLWVRSKLLQTSVSVDQGNWMNDFEIGAQVGQGAFGKVFKARRISTNQQLAVKVKNVTGRSESQLFFRLLPANHQKESILHYLSCGHCQNWQIIRIYSSFPRPI